MNGSGLMVAASDASGLGVSDDTMLGGATEPASGDSPVDGDAEGTGPRSPAPVVGRRGRAGGHAQREADERDSERRSHRAIIRQATASASRSTSSRNAAAASADRERPSRAGQEDDATDLPLARRRGQRDRDRGVAGAEARPHRHARPRRRRARERAARTGSGRSAGASSRLVRSSSVRVGRRPPVPPRR